MPAFVRIERCPTEAVANHRVDALRRLGYQACWSRDDAVINTFNVDDGSNPDAGATVVVASPFVVVAINCA